MPASRSARTALLTVAALAVLPAVAAAAPPTFAPAQVAGSTGGRPVSIALADLSGDGRLDIATADANKDTVTVLTQDAGDGTFTRAAFPAGDEPVSVAVGDLNGDGRPDIATANQDDETVTVLFKDAVGYTAAVAGPTGPVPTAVAIGDLNGDGRPTSRPRMRPRAPAR